MKSGIVRQQSFSIINLENFESPEAANSPYVLTSPRSLKACKKAGIKPVELLYRTCQEVAIELSLSVNHARHIYYQQEVDRQRKLTLCRKVRDELKNNKSNFHFFRGKSTQSSKHIHTGCNSKQKSRVSRCRFTLTTDSDESRRNSPMLSDYKSPANYPSSRDLLTIRTSSYDNAKADDRHTHSKSLELFHQRRTSSNTENTSYENANTNRSHSMGKYHERRASCKLGNSSYDHSKTDDRQAQAKSSEAYHPRTPSCNTELTASSPESLKARPISYSGLSRNVRKFSDPGIADEPPTSIATKPRSKHIDDIQTRKLEKYEMNKPDSKEATLTLSDTNHKKHAAGVRVSSLSPNLDLTASYAAKIDKSEPSQKFNRPKAGVHDKKDDSSKNSDTGNTSTTSSEKEKTCKRVKLKNKENKTVTLNSFYTHNISSKDKRILESLSQKRLEEIQNQERTLEAHKLWEEDRKTLDQKREQKREEWNSFVERKRKLESDVNRMRMEEVKENLRRAQTLLETRLEERDKRMEEAIQETFHKKTRACAERRDTAEKRRVLVEANHLHLQLQRLMKHEECEHELGGRLRRAETLRQRGLRNFHKKVSNANKLEELRHKERMEDLFEEDKCTRNQKLQELHEREDRVIRRYMEQVRYKLEAIKKNSMDRELKSQQARQTLRELEEGLETWQDHVMLMQWDALRRSEANAKLLLANRRLRLECENKERMLQHSRRFRKKKMDESRKLKSIIEEIRNKEEKIKSLQRTRERDVNECRLRAHSAAELREQIRNTLTPETFDRKVSRVNMEVRVGSRPPSASPTLMRSHIRLG